MNKQAPPGPPPREGLKWKPQTRRWIRPIGIARDLPARDSGERYHPLKRKFEQNDAFSDFRGSWGDKRRDFGSPTSERYGEVVSWLSGGGTFSVFEPKRIMLAEGDPLTEHYGSVPPQDLNTAIFESLVADRYPNNHNVNIPKRHLRKIKDITLTTKKEAAEAKAVSISTEGQIIAGRMTKKHPSSASSSMELFDAANVHKAFPLEFAQTVVHEMAHAVYWGTPLWYQIGITNLYTKAVQKNNGLPSQYSKEDVNEFFAECYTAYVTNTNAFRERNPSMASELDKLFSKNLRNRRGKFDPSKEYPKSDPFSTMEHFEKIIRRENPGDTEQKYSEFVTHMFGLTSEEYEMHRWNNANKPTDKDKAISAVEEFLTMMLKKTIVSENPTVIEDPEGVIGFTEGLPNADPIEMPPIPEESFGEEEIEKQAPPGPPPREGLKWKPQTHRWIRPEEAVSAVTRGTGPWVYHKTNEKVLQSIVEQGFSQGDFIEGMASFRKVDFPGEVTLRVKQGDLPSSQVGEYTEGVKWHLPNWESPETSISSDLIDIRINKAGDPATLQESDITWMSLREYAASKVPIAQGAAQESKARIKEIITEVKGLLANAHRGQGLTASQADRYQQLTHEMSSIQFDLQQGRSLNVDRIKPASERLSKLSTDEVVVAHKTLFSDKDVYMAMSEHAAGTWNASSTILDDIVNGTNQNVSLEQLYGTFSPVRDSLRQKHGDTIHLYRATGKQIDKPTTNWASTRELALKYGTNIIERDVPTDNIMAVNVGRTGNYEELIVSSVIPAAKKIQKEGDGGGTVFTSANAGIFTQSQQIKKEIEKQAPPGPPPREGLKWKPQTHRWIRPEDFHQEALPIHQLEEVQKVQIQSSLDNIQHEIRDREFKIQRDIWDVAREFGLAYEGSEPGGELFAASEDLKEKTTNALQTLLNKPETFVWTRVQESNLRKILDEGVFRTIHDTGKTGPGKPAASGKDRLEKYLNDRKVIEQQNFGEDANPIYAYLSDQDEGKLREQRVLKSKTDTSSAEVHYEDVAVMYGNMRVKLKPHVRQKTTVSNGDSYDNPVDTYHQFMSDVDYKMYPRFFSRLAMTQSMPEEFDKGFKTGIEAFGPRTSEQKEALKAGIESFVSRVDNGDIKFKDLTYNYYEAQIHGGLSTNDIKEIVIDYKWNKSANKLDVDEEGNPKVSKSVLKKLDDLGIPWRFGARASAENIYKFGIC